MPKRREQLPAEKASRAAGNVHNVAGLFAGIGGFERGLHRGGHQLVLLCENDLGASAVLSARFLSSSLSQLNEPSHCCRISLRNCVF